MSHPSSLPYRADIDGLRALAVVPVLLFHAGLGCPGGFVGVDVFFTISGYLIGSLVLAELRAGTFSMAGFWERRIRRIFPALALVVVATLAVGAWVMVPGHFEDLGKSVAAQPLLVANFLFWRESGYFDTASEFQPLLHTWSLAVEEQFYLFFPVVMMLVLKGGERCARLVVIAFIAISLAWCLYATPRFPSASFYLIPSRIWELDIGVLLALLSPRRRARPGLDDVLGWLGLGLILFAVFTYSVNTPFPGWAALLPCLGTALLIYSNAPSANSTGRLLSLQPVVFIGKISYSLYLWHWPAIVLTKYLLVSHATPLHLAGALLLSAVLAVLSYRYVETPFRTRRLLRERRRLFAATGVVAALLAGVGALVYRGEGMPSRMPEEVRRHTKVPSPYVSVRGIDQLVSEANLPVLGDSTATASGKVLLWGDSHAMSLLPVFDELGKVHRVAVLAATQPEIAPVAGTYTPGRRHHRLEHGDLVVACALEQGIDEVVLAARWSIYAFGTPDGDRRWLLGDADTATRRPEEAQQVFAKRLRETVVRLSEGGARVWFFREVGLQPFSVPEAVAQAASRGMDLNAFALPVSRFREERAPLDALVERALDGLPVGFLDPLPVLADGNGLYPMAADGVALYQDRHHLSPYGSKRLSALFAPVFEAASRDAELDRE